MTLTLGDLISDLLDVYERAYDDHELATVKTALVVDDLLQARAARLTETDATRLRRAVRGAARGLPEQHTSPRMS
jgi:hypothetical protein